MSTVGSYDRTKFLGELNTPLFGVNPVPITPAAQKAAARANLGATGSADVTAAIAAAAIAGFANSTRFAGAAAVNQATPAVVNTSATISGNTALSGIITTTTAAAVTITLPAAAGGSWDDLVLARYPGLQNGDSFDFSVINTGVTNAATIATATGWTLVGNMAVAASSSGRFRAVRTSSTAWVMYRMA